MIPNHKDEKAEFFPNHLSLHSEKILRKIKKQQRIEQAISQIWLA